MDCLRRLSIVLCAVTMARSATAEGPVVRALAPPGAGLSLAMAVADGSAPVVGSLGFRAMLADGTVGFATAALAAVAQEGAARVCRFALTGSAAAGAAVTARLEPLAGGVAVRFDVRYRGEPQQWSGWTSGVCWTPARPVLAMSRSAVRRWVTPGAGAVPGDFPYPDFDRLVGRFEVAGTPPVALVADWYAPDWGYGGTPEAGRLIPVRLPAEGSFERQFGVAVVAGDGTPEECAARATGEPVAVTVASDRPGSLYAPDEAVLLNVTLARTGGATGPVDLAWQVFDYDGNRLLDGSSRVALAAGERQAFLVPVPFSRRGILFVRCGAAAGAWRRDVWTTVGILPRRPLTVMGPAGRFGLAAVCARPDRYPDQPDLGTLAAILQRVGVRWLRHSLPVGPALTDEETVRLRTDVETLRRHGISSYPQISGDVVAKPGWEPSVRDALAAFNWASGYVEFGNEWNPSSGSAESQEQAGREHVRERLVPFLGLMRAAHPHGKAVTHGLGGIWGPYLKGLGEGGGWAAFDVLSVHPGFHPRAPEWDGPGQEAWALLPQLRTLERAMQRYGHKEWWVTELYAPTPAGPTGLDLRTAADYLVRSCLVCLGAGARAVLWYQFQDGVWFAQVPRPTDAEYNFGLVYTDLAPKPALLAYATMTEQLEGLRYVGRVNLGDDRLYGLAFGPAYIPEVCVLWSYRERHELDRPWSELKDMAREPGMPWQPRWRESVSVTLPALSLGTVQVTDTMGNTRELPPLDGQVTLELSGSPLFVRGLNPEALVQRGLCPGPESVLGRPR